jgi:hypothetical protein
MPAQDPPTTGEPFLEYLGEFVDYLHDAARAILAGGERFVLIRDGRAELECALPGPPAVLSGGVAFRSELLAEDPDALEELYADDEGRYLLDEGMILAYGRARAFRELEVVMRAADVSRRPEVLSRSELERRPGGRTLAARWRAGDDRQLDEDRRLRWAREALGVAARGRARLRWGLVGPTRQRST